MKYFKTLPLAAALAQAVTDPTTLDTADAGKFFSFAMPWNFYDSNLTKSYEIYLTYSSISDSIKSVAGTLAYDAMTYYKGNTSSNPIVSKPLSCS